VRYDIYIYIYIYIYVIRRLKVNELIIDTENAIRKLDPKIQNTLILCFLSVVLNGVVL
jgi:hypothetical protein